MKLILKGILTLALLGFLAYQLELRALAQVLASARLSLLIPAVLIQLALVFVSVTRWRSVLGNFQVRIGYFPLAKIAFIGNFFNLFLPTAIGGDFFRAYYLAKRENRGMSTTLTTTVLERSGGLCALLLIGTFSALFGAVAVQGVPLIRVFLVLSVGYLAVNFALFNPRLHDLLGKLLRRLGQKQLQARMDLVYEGLQTLSRNSRTIALVLGLSLLVQFSSVFIVWIAAQALSIEAPFHLFLIFIPMINLSIMVPLTINGFGLRESLYLLLFSQIGLQQEKAVALSLLNTLVVMLAALPGGIVYSLYKKDEGFDRALQQGEIE